MEPQALFPNAIVLIPHYRTIPHSCTYCALSIATHFFGSGSGVTYSLHSGIICHMNIQFSEGAESSVVRVQSPPRTNHTYTQARLSCHGPHHQNATAITPHRRCRTCSNHPGAPSLRTHARRAHALVSLCGGGRAGERRRAVARDLWERPLPMRDPTRERKRS